MAAAQPAYSDYVPIPCPKPKLRLVVSSPGKGARRNKKRCSYGGRPIVISRARYYDPKVGRFITRDPIGFDGGDVNLYNYVGGNPVNRTDPEGLFWPIDCVKCFYYRKKLDDAAAKCREELGLCKTMEDEINFMQKYGGVFLGSALWNCATQKVGNDTWGKLSKSCFKCGFMPTGPKPVSLGR
jgi:hypothetical protein